MEEDPHKIFSHKSRSFSMAAQLFAPDTRDHVARLYRFCRYVDDLADHAEHGSPQQLREVVNSLKSDQDCEGHPCVQDFLHLVETCNLQLKPAVELLQTLENDCGKREILDVGELIRYSYGVAGTVGKLMIPLLGVKHVQATPFAVDLGIAFQLTNISRDVFEDAQRSRFYLPAEWVNPETVRLACSQKDSGKRELVDFAVLKILKLAEKYYASAAKGLWFIPKRNRIAIFVGLKIYRAIGRKMLRKGSGAWLTRTSLSCAEKCLVVARALPEWIRYERDEWSWENAPEHASSLHEELRPIGG